MTEKKEKIDIGIPSIGIPGEVLFNPKLSPREKILFGFLRNLSQSDKGCTASNRYLSNIIGTQGQTVTNALNQLKKYHYIIVTFESNQLTNEQKRHIYINTNYTKIYEEYKKIAHEVYVKGNIELLKNLYGAIKKIIGGYNLNNIKYDNKDDTKKENVILKNNNIDESEIRQTNPLLDYWNSLDNVMKHKNPNTKIYQKCVKDLRSLRCGTFYCKNPVDPKFLQKHRLPNPKNKKFTNDEIKASMKNLSLLLTGGYGYDNGNGLSWPDDNLRTRLRTLSFVDLLWHPRTNKSFFLLVLHNPPQLLKEASVIIPFNLEYYSIMEVLINSKYHPLDVCKKKQLIHRIEQILKFQRRIIKKHMSMQQNFNFQRKVGYEDDPTHFLNTYIEWMMDNVDIPISVKMIGPEGFCWSDFCQYLKTECYCQNI